MFSLFCKYVVLRFLELLTVKGDQNSFIKERQSKKYLISSLCLSHKKMKLKKKVKVDKNCFFNFQIFDTCVFNLCFQFSFFSFFFFFLFLFLFLDRKQIRTFKEVNLTSTCFSFIIKVKAKLFFFIFYKNHILIRFKTQLILLFF